MKEFAATTDLSASDFKFRLRMLRTRVQCLLDIEQHITVQDVLDLEDSHEPGVAFDHRHENLNDIASRIAKEIRGR